MGKYAIGIDGGGSRSRLAAIDESGKLIGRAEGGSTNITAVSYEKVFLNIQNLVNDFCASANVDLSDCASIFIGSAGASAGENAKLLAQIFHDLGFEGQLKITNDAELVLLAETNNEPGGIIISGTGSVGYSVDKSGNIFRVGGWGHIIDDDGSGYRIGMDAIKATLMDIDGRGDKTLLSKLVTDFFGGMSPDELTGYVYGKEFAKSKVAEIAMLVMDAAKKGDKLALDIERRAADSLISVARALIKRAELDSHKIALSGSVILHNEHIRSIFEAEICRSFPKMRITEIADSAELGAAQLALREHVEKSGF